MLEGVKSNFERLVALYEAQKQRAEALSSKLAQCESENKSYKEQMTDLNRQIDILKLSGAFTGSGDGSQARERLDKLIRDIDKCIALLEN